MAVRKQYHLLAWTLALVAVIGYSSITWPTKQDSVQELKKGGWGSAEEASATASRMIKDYISTLGDGAVAIDPQFRATLHSRSKIWTVKGYANSGNDHQSYRSYRWTVILEYDGVRDWEVIEKIVTPVFAAPVSGVIEGFSQTQGKLCQADPND